MELRFKRSFEYVKVIPLSRCSTGPRALFHDDQVVMKPTIITLIFLPTFPYFLLLSLASSAFSKLCLFFLITRDLNRHFGATSASLRMEDRAFTQLSCSQAIHRLGAFDLRYIHRSAPSDISLKFVAFYRKV